MRPAEDEQGGGDIPGIDFGQTPPEAGIGQEKQAQSLELVDIHDDAGRGKQGTCAGRPA